ncbi:MULTISPECIES: UDP-N-acetylmuramoyl-L-alanine--D-glutamate ligase [Flavobacteriaceae]|uniref:UDP-N-acetylmuramoylalanine--D-glutamate ligase n=2 Tax=Flavobacteriaceae TaxID=49546 RepID=A0A4Y8AT14_9FLAO|nr:MULTISPECIES: UDP-N-acetylmuramoyl-L-alanine--D-glutamate ligase [Flavobacteriaceae]TEW75014.1 UDP-N-acetylmuramoyl-L-alanine--D-glutamate ligase [Gramella jeungdoensis]GGK42279.1 UDP-N-acetylmuramoylalanine--D-glutamate ligase [Lutibacter litoralis]
MNLVVLGAGESGVGAAILGKQKGYNVFVSDKGEITKKYKKVLLNNEIPFEEGTHSESKIFQADVVMKSPGIPDKVAVIQELIERKIPVISEIEFASKYTKGIIVGITGSNGKTTTTLLVNHILKKANLNVGMGGNIGASFAQQVAENNFDIHVLELSSFQLDGIVNFAPHIAIITNITPDHLDRYNNKFENYINSKFRITENQTENDFLIYDADDEVITNWLKNNKVKATLLPFSLGKELEEGVFLKDNNIQIKYKTEDIIMGITTLALKGKHNTKNAMAAAMTATLLKVRKDTIRESLEDFEGAEHRLESVLKINGVQYINDSKATNVNATFYALDSMKTPTVWIVGGVDKGNDYLDLMPLVREKVKAIICLGVDNHKIVQTFNNVVDLIVETAGAEEAVKVAYKIAEKGDAVLLSPACASFDLFESYEDRGNQFKQAVREL